MSSKAIFTVGRRKTSIARVKVSPGQGNIKVNGKTVAEYFPVPRLATKAVSGLTLVGAQDQFDITINVTGGGVAGQAGAVRMGISRALQSITPDTRPHLKKAGFLTRDSRMVERKKYGLRKARRGTQFSKR